MKEKRFVAYLTAGDGGMEASEKAFLALAEGGVDILEIGVPFSDPVADGPVIQHAMKRSLDRGTTPSDVLDLVGRLRKQLDIPLVLFSYFNPILQGGEEFIRRAKEVGVDALLIVDLPPDSAFPFREVIERHLPLIKLVAPSTDLERVKKLSKKEDLFLYYVCRKGTTGMRNALPEDFKEKLRAIKSVTNVPVVSGFGIANQEMAEKTLEIADGFVVGSYFVKACEEGASPQTLTKLAKELDPRRPK